MQLSIACDYAIKAMTELAANGDGRILTISEIARRRNLPPTFLAKVTRRLVRAGLLKTRRGTAGGLGLARPAADITFLQIIESVDGPAFRSLCLTDPGKCPLEKRCRFREVWLEAQKKQIAILQDTKLTDLIGSVEDMKVVFDNQCI